MRKLLELLSYYHPFLLFLLLQAVCFLMINQSQHFQRTRIMHAANFAGGSLFSQKSNFTDYLDLRAQNDSLAKMNALLLDQQFLQASLEFSEADTIRDTIYQQLYHFQSAKVLNLSTHKQYNYMTINRGSKDGVEVDMGVMTKDGVVGKVQFVSANYASVMSLLNKKCTVPAKIKKNNTSSPVSWDGRSSEFVQLNFVTESVNVRQGDTIVTSGFSSIFPENIPVGIVEAVDLQAGENFHDVDVRPFTDLGRVKHVYVIDFVDKEEIKSLEVLENEQ